MTQRGPDLIMDCLYVTLHLADDLLAAFTGPHRSGDCGDVGIDVGQRFGSEAEKAGARLQNFADRLFLVGNGRDDEVWFGGEYLFGVRGPGIRDDRSRRTGDFGDYVRAIFGAGDDAL